MYKFKQPVFIAELDLTALLESAEKAVQYRPLPRYPAVVRDVTLLLDRKVSLAELLKTLSSEAVADYRGAKLVGTYEGANIAQDKRSVTLRIEYRSDERTLRDEEIEEKHSRLVDSLLQNFAAELH
jgi:phenylalanyl-tRNA synthetase beta chain